MIWNEEWSSICDVFLDREGLAESSAATLEACEAGNAIGALAIHSASNLYYILRSKWADRRCRKALADLGRFLEIAAAGDRELMLAINSPVADFEDALQDSSALAFEADYIVTRNIKHFRRAATPAIKPEDFVELLSASGGE